MRSTGTRGVLCVVILICLFGCSVENELFLRSDGTGSGTLRITIDPVVSLYVKSLASAFGYPKDETLELFDIESIRGGIDQREGLETVSVVKEDDRSIIVSFRITDVHKAFGDVVSFSHIETEAGGTRSIVEFDLNRRSFLSLSGLFLEEDSPASLFIPLVQSDFLPRSEYRELVSYAFGEYLEARDVSTLIESSTVEIEIETDGTIAEVDGGLIGENSALFTLQVLDCVTLEDPVLLALAWR